MTYNATRQRQTTPTTRKTASPALPDYTYTYDADGNRVRKSNGTGGQREHSTGT